MRVHYKMPQPKFNFGDVVIYESEKDHDEPQLYVITSIGLRCGLYGRGEWEYNMRGQFFGISEGLVGEDQIALYAPSQNDNYAEIKNSFYRGSIPSRCQEWPECECKDEPRCLIASGHFPDGDPYDRGKPQW